MTLIIDGLFEAVAARFGRFPITGPMLIHLWKRCTRIKQRFATLATRIARGKFSSRAPAPRAGARRDRKPARPESFRITRLVRPNCGWLCRVTPGALGASDYAIQLRDLLTTDPSMRALLAATPATARLLRPLCWMLGIIDVLPPPLAVPAVPPCAAEFQCEPAAPVPRAPGAPGSSPVVPPCAGPPRQDLCPPFFKTA